MPPAEEAVEGFVDLAALGWRLLRAPVTKHKDDRWGSEGISVRCLARIALATDILMERPKHARPQGRNRSRAGGFADEVRIARLALVASAPHEGSRVFHHPGLQKEAQAPTRGRAGGRRRANATRGGEQGALASPNERGVPLSHPKALRALAL